MSRVPNILLSGNGPMVFFDLETTGTNPTTDRIIQLAAVRLDDDKRTDKVWWINPGIPIPLSASEVHDITDDDVENCPKFEDVASEIYKVFEGAILIGYNILRFDAIMLSEELRRAGYPTLYDHRMIDAFGIFASQEPRTLAGAVRFYCERDMKEGAHDAMVDVEETIEVFCSQLLRYKLGIQNDIGVTKLSQMSKNKGAIDLQGKIVDSPKGPVISFGKHKGRLLKDVARREPTYIKWLIRENVIPDQVDMLRSLVGM